MPTTTAIPVVVFLCLPSTVMASIFVEELWFTLSGSSLLHTAWRGQRSSLQRNTEEVETCQENDNKCVSLPLSALLWKSTYPGSYKVVLGIHTERGREASRQDRNIVRIEMGPNRADIGLLKLETWVSFLKLQYFNISRSSLVLLICCYCRMIRLEMDEKSHSKHPHVCFAVQHI